MSSKELKPTTATKTVTTRFYSLHDSDIVEMAIKESGVGQSEWSRQALLLFAELQIMKGGLLGLTLKNVLLIRRLIQGGENFSREQISEAMAWSAKEFEKHTSLETKSGKIS